jgi:hypothetical protein
MILVAAAVASLIAPVAKAEANRSYAQVATISEALPQLHTQCDQYYRLVRKNDVEEGQLRIDLLKLLATENAKPWWRRDRKTVLFLKSGLEYLRVSREVSEMTREQMSISCGYVSAK